MSRCAPQKTRWQPLKFKWREVGAGDGWGLSITPSLALKLSMRLAVPHSPSAPYAAVATSAYRETMYMGSSRFSFYALAGRSCVPPLQRVAIPGNSTQPRSELGWRGAGPSDKSSTSVGWQVRRGRSPAPRHSQRHHYKTKYTILTHLCQVRQKTRRKSAPNNQL